MHAYFIDSHVFDVCNSMTWVRLGLFVLALPRPSKTPIALPVDWGLAATVD